MTLSHIYTNETFVTSKEVLETVKLLLHELLGKYSSYLINEVRLFLFLIFVRCHGLLAYRNTMIDT